jgi:hypothetical protein
LFFDVKIIRKKSPGYPGKTGYSVETEKSWKKGRTEMLFDALYL